MPRRSKQAVDGSNANRQSASLGNDKQVAKDLFGFSDTSCHCCGVDNSALGGFLLQCAACKAAYYCGVDCFNKHLPTHMEFCQTTALDKAPQRRIPAQLAQEQLPTPQPQPASGPIKTEYNDCSSSDEENDGKRRQAEKLKRRSSPNKKAKRPPMKRTFTDGACTESDTESESGPVPRRGGGGGARDRPVQVNAAQKRVRSRQSTRLPKSSADASDSGAAVPMSNDANEVASSFATVKRSFLAGSCSESGTDEELTVSHVLRRASLGKEARIVGDHDASATLPDTAMRSSPSIEKPLNRVKRVYNVGSASESDTEPDCASGSDHRDAKSAVQCVFVASCSESESAPDGAVGQKATEEQHDSHMPPSETAVSGPKSDSAVALETRLSSLQEFEVKRGTNASKSIESFYRRQINAISQRQERELYPLESDLNTEKWETASDTEEWETASDSSYSSSQALAYESDLTSRDVGSLDIALESIENLQDDTDGRTDSFDNTYVNGRGIHRNVPQTGNVRCHYLPGVPADGPARMPCRATSNGTCTKNDMCQVLLNTQADGPARMPFTEAYDGEEEPSLGKDTRIDPVAGALDTPSEHTDVYWSDSDDCVEETTRRCIGGGDLYGPINVSSKEEKHASKAEVRLHRDEDIANNDGEGDKKDSSEHNADRRSSTDRHLADASEVDPKTKAAVESTSDDDESVEFTCTRIGGGTLNDGDIVPFVNRTESASSILKPAVRTVSHTEWEKPEWTEAQ
jgi:MYND finger